MKMKDCPLSLLDPPMVFNSESLFSSYFSIHKNITNAIQDSLQGAPSQIPLSSVVEANFAGKFRFAMQQDSDKNELENGIEIVEFKRISDNKNILYISNIPAKFHEDELQVDTD